MLVQKDFSVSNFWRFSGLILLFSVEAVALTVAFRSLVKIVDAILMPPPGSRAVPVAILEIEPRSHSCV